MHGDEDFKNANWAVEGEPIIPIAKPYQEPLEHTLSLIILSTYGDVQAIIENICLQGADGSIIDNVLIDKWYFNPKQLPEFLTFSVISHVRPSYILICNGQGKLATRGIELKYDGEPVWRGDLPVGTEPKAWFPIAVPSLSISQSGPFKIPSITAFREMDNIPRQ